MVIWWHFKRKQACTMYFILLQFCIVDPSIKFCSTVAFVILYFDKYWYINIQLIHKYFNEYPDIYSHFQYFSIFYIVAILSWSAFQPIFATDHLWFSILIPRPRPIMPVVQSCWQRGIKLFWSTHLVVRFSHFCWCR